MQSKEILFDIENTKSIFLYF